MLTDIIAVAGFIVTCYGIYLTKKMACPHTNKTSHSVVIVINVYFRIRR